MGLRNNEYEKWKRKRFTTFILFWLIYLSTGIFGTLSRTTCFIYLKTHFTTVPPDLNYSLVICMSCLPALMFTFAVSSLHDTYRKTRLIMIFINFMTITGGILYTIDLPYFFPIIGSFLLGFQILAQTVAVGEITRSYTPKEINYKVPVLQFGFFFGALPAAAIVRVIENIKFNIGPFKIDFSNMLAAVTVVGFSLIQILTIFFVHDLSLEYDLKECFLINEEVNKNEVKIAGVNKKIKSKEDVLKEIEEDKDHKKILTNCLKRLFSNYDVVLMYHLVALFYCCWGFFTLYFPVIVIKELRYEVEILNILYLLFSVLLLVFLPLLILFKVGSKTAYYFGLISFSLLILVCVCLRMTDANASRLYNISLLTFVMILLAVVFPAEDISLTCTIAKLVKSDIQTFADGVRTTIFTVAFMMASFSIVFVKNYLNLLLTRLLLLILLSLTFKRRWTLMNPQAIV